MRLRRQVAVLVAGRAVHSKAHSSTGQNEVLYSAGAGTQSHVAGGAVGDAGSGFGDAVDLSVAEMDPVRVPDVLSGPAEVFHQLQRPATEALEAKAFFIKGLREVGMEANAATPSQRG